MRLGRRPAAPRYPMREFHVRDVRRLHRLDPAIKFGIATAAPRDIGSQL
jgi:hypothetical protein